MGQPLSPCGTKASGGGAQPSPPICRNRNKIPSGPLSDHLRHSTEALPMNSIIYLVGLVVIVMAILSFIGLA